MNGADGEDVHRSRLRRVELLLRGAVPLVLVALALLAGPTLLVWWLSGEPLGWRHALIGGGISLALLVAMALAFGWAVGGMLAPRMNSRARMNEFAGKDAAGKDAAGKDAAGKDAAGKDAAGKDE